MAWNSLLEDCNFIETQDFFKQILWGCFGLRTASEVKSDLIIGFLLANMPYPPNFRSLGHPHGLQKLVEREREERETDNYYTCGTASLPQVKTHKTASVFIQPLLVLPPSSFLGFCLTPNFIRPFSRNFIHAIILPAFRLRLDLCILGGEAECRTYPMW